MVSSLKRLLRGQGLDVQVASNGSQALRLLEDRASQIGTIVSDYNMPGMTGLELLVAARARWPNVRRILLTGNANLVDLSRAAEPAALSNLLAKPYEPEALSRALR